MYSYLYGFAALLRADQNIRIVLVDHYATLAMLLGIAASHALP